MSKRRDKGSGTIYRMQDGSGWKVEINIDGKRYVRRGKTKSEVQDKLNALKRDEARGTLSVDQSTTVSTLVNDYVERVVPNRKSRNHAHRLPALYSCTRTHPFLDDEHGYPACPLASLS